MTEQDNKRQRRTPEQIVADMEAELQAAKARAAKAAAREHPELQGLNEKIEATRKAKIKARTTIAQADKRIAKHEAWITKIQGETEEARDILMTADSELEMLTTQLEQRAAELAAEA